MTRNLLVTLVEALCILIVFLLLTGITRWAIARTVRAASLTRFQDAANAVSRTLRTFYLVLLVVLLLADLGVNGWLVYQRNDLLTFKLGLLARIPPGFWVTLAVALGKLFALALFVGLMLRPVTRAVNYLCLSLQRISWLRVEEGDAEALSHAAQRHVARLAWLLVLICGLDWIGLGELRQRYAALVVQLYVVVALAHLARLCVRIVVLSLDAAADTFTKERGLERYYRVVHALMPALRRSLEAIIAVSAATAIVSLIEVLQSLSHWGTLAIQVIGILFLSRVLAEVIGMIIEEFLVLRGELNESQQKRRRTVLPLLSAFLRYAIYFLAAMIIITQFGINPMPLLAGAGIAGVAIGIGAQSLISDLVAGFFTLFENYYLVGDFVSLDNREGEVEMINFRATWLRDLSGRVHILRNGQIHSIINYSREYVYAIVDVSVAYDTNLDMALDSLREVGAWAKEHSTDVLDNMQVLGVETLGDSSILLRTRTRVKPAKHLTVQRLVRKRIKEIFEARGIEIPFNHQVVIVKTEAGVELVAKRETAQP